MSFQLMSQTSGETVLQMGSDCAVEPRFEAGVNLADRKSRHARVAWQRRSAQTVTEHSKEQASLAAKIGMLMLNWISTWIAVAWLLLLPASAQLSPNQIQSSPLGASAKSSVNMVASVHPLATEAGLKAFAQGGNAIDAAIATALTLGVVDGSNSGIGGGCFILLRTADGQLIAIDGRERAPAAAHRDLFVRDGVADGRLSQTGALAIGIPGAMAAYHEAASQYGKLEFRNLILPAAELAECGFEVTPLLQTRIELEKEGLKQFPASAEILLKPDGSVPQVGEKIVQTDLGNTYRRIAEEGIGWFYRGPFSDKVAAWSQENGGIITTQDFADYRTVRREPMRTCYRGYEVVGFPPPSSGGVHVAQILNILENFQLNHQTAEAGNRARHVVAEAMKLAFADRAYWLGDPDYIKVPKGLIDKEYAAQLAGKISLDATTQVLSHGTPPNHLDQFFGGHTTHIAAADRQGNWVAITTTLNTAFGSKVIVPGLGVIMNNQMDDFSIAPGVPNAFGLVGGENNAVASGKRPLSSMSPTMVLRDGQPILTLGAAGGPTIISQVVWTVVWHLDFGVPIDQAVEATRLHHQWSPDRLRVEKTLEQSTRDYLTAKGHHLEVVSSLGATQAISFDPETGWFHGAADPRVNGAAAGTPEAPK